MADIVSPQKRSDMMSGIKGKNTKPEIIIRKALHAEGFRFRLHDKKLPGKPDIVLSKFKIAIFVNGCFWHGHENCRLYRTPKSRAGFWNNKIGTNIKRDTARISQLRNIGWKVITVWECTVKNKSKLDNNLIQALKEIIKSPLVGSFYFREDPCDRFEFLIERKA